MKTFDNWQLKGLSDIEPIAWQALKSTGHTCVTAGPGAGKTEFLAQKAAYLLETGLCPFPFRILAISFKKEAAENLESRVKKRCKIEHSSRFESITFDAFTKSIVDRFQLSLPTEWQLSDGYEIANFNANKYQMFLSKIKAQNPKYQSESAKIKAPEFQSIMLPLYKISSSKPTTFNDYACNAWFKSIRDTNEVDFLFLNRLADFIIRENILVHNAIKQTYKFIFADEFQDTSYSQYDFLCSVLSESTCKVTAVGDNKQRIMLWAGARPDAFEQFKYDFKAAAFNLLMNYRSSPGLVQIQHFLASTIESDCVEMQSGVTAEITENIAQIWNFNVPNAESNFIAEWIVSDSKERKLLPKDYAILVRQRADDFHNELTKSFDKNGLQIRNESRIFGKLSLQDILSDDCFILLSALLRLGIQNKAPSAWTIAAHYFVLIFGEDGSNKPSMNSDGYLAKLLKDTLRPALSKLEISSEALKEIARLIINHVGIANLKGAFPHYAAGDNLKILIDSIVEFLIYCVSQTNSWQEFIDYADGVDQIPLLTIHKSKGLEYDTVIFMGFDDTSWWSYSPDNPEGKATFFVGLSRAKQRVIFTYSKGKSGRDKITELYDLLKHAGVPEITI
jgi:superfamily I DNA/RNA helicase